MPRFFIKDSDIDNNNTVTLYGDAASHISRSLRMRVGDGITLCDGQKNEYRCIIEKMTSESVTLSVKEKVQSANEPDVFVSVYQALPKSTKMELIIQKCVELGVGEIIPVLSSRCISRPDDKSSKRKNERYNAISEEAAKQSGRAFVPEVCETMDFDSALSAMSNADAAFMCYEAAGNESYDIKAYLQNNLSEDTRTIAFFVGPEGGISPDEADKAIASGIVPITLGNRILRTETAAMCVLSCIMYETNNLK